MRKLAIFLIVVSFVLSPVTLCAATKASEKASEPFDIIKTFDNASDWFATLGKSETEKKKILAVRKADRAKKKVEEKRKAAKKKAEEARKKLKKKLGR